MNFRFSLWSLLAWACIAAGVFGLGALAGSTYADTYHVAAVVPLYGAGAAPVAVGSEPTGDSGQPEWAKRVEAKVDKLLKLLEEIDDKTPDANAGAEAPKLSYRADLSPADRSRIVRKVKRADDERMPPPKAEQLTKEERDALVAAFSGQQADQALVGAAGAKCAGCHSPSNAKKGGEFVLFQVDK